MTFQLCRWKWEIRQRSQILWGAWKRDSRLLFLSWGCHLLSVSHHLLCIPASVSKCLLTKVTSHTEGRSTPMTSHSPITWSHAEVPGFGLQNTLPWEAQFNQPQRSLHQCPCFSAGLRRRGGEPGREPIHQCPIPSHLYLLPKQHSGLLAGPQSSTIVTSFKVPHSSWNELFNQNTNLIMAEPT